jgi:hypothetical protein
MVTFARSQNASLSSVPPVGLMSFVIELIVP